MIRLIATDMDGTLLVHGVTGIPDENLRAMKQAAARGIHVALCSGRMPEDMSFFASDAGLNVHILALNGSYCLDVPHGPCVSSHTMQPADAQALRGMLQAYPGLHYETFSGNDLVVNMAPSDDWEINVGTNLRRPGGKTRVAVNQEERQQQMLAQGENKLAGVDEAMRSPGGFPAWK